MTNIELKRSHEGKVDLFVSGIPALGAEFNGINTLPNGKQCAVIVVPLDQLSFGEQSVVVPFPVVVR